MSRSILEPGKTSGKDSARFGVSIRHVPGDSL